MPSTSYHQWRTVRTAALDEIDAAVATLGGTGRGSRYTNQQVIRSYVLLLASHFQGFCRDLHSECVDHLLNVLAPPLPLRHILSDELTRGRQLDRGNAQPGSLGTDFGRLGIDFWVKMQSSAPDSATWKRDLELLNDWRNAIAHQDFTSPRLGGTMNLRLNRVRHWRTSCRLLARTTDVLMHRYLHTLTGTAPW